MVTQDTAATARATSGIARGRAAEAVRFGRHFVEMVVAMVVGMAVLGAAFRGLVAASGLDYAEEQAQLPELFALVMAFNMTAGMAAWMRHRGHGWGSVAEMGGAMVVPVLALCPLLWLGAIGTGSLFALMHALMLPAMLAVMLYRRDDYLHRHGSERAAPGG
jgi:hypothetical protein